MFLSLPLFESSLSLTGFVSFPFVVVAGAFFFSSSFTSTMFRWRKKAEEVQQQLALPAPGTNAPAAGAAQQSPRELQALQRDNAAYRERMAKLQAETANLKAHLKKQKELRNMESFKFQLLLELFAMRILDNDVDEVTAAEAASFVPYCSYKKHVRDTTHSLTHSPPPPQQQQQQGIVATQA